MLLTWSTILKINFGSYFISLVPAVAEKFFGKFLGGPVLYFLVFPAIDGLNILFKTFVLVEIHIMMKF
jgi:hypothetical protein